MQRVDALTEALESSLFLLPPYPGAVKPLAIPGVRARATPASHPITNLVGCATLAEEEVPAVVGRLRAQFEPGKQMWGWLVGPHSTPPSLGEQLHAAGLSETIPMAGMALTELATPIQTPTTVVVQEVDAAALETLIVTYERAYPFPPAASRAILTAFFGRPDQVRSRHYLAYESGGAEPIGAAMMVYLLDQPIVLLWAAATHPDYRGRGVYRALLARRLADAHQDGIQAAIIQAMRGTSAPICARLGFRELCSLTLHYAPPPA